MFKRLAFIGVALFFLSLPALGGKGRFNKGTPAKLDVIVVFDYELTGADRPEDWKPLFDAASELLYDVSEKQLQLGKVECYVNCPKKLSQADIVISSLDNERGTTPILTLPSGEPAPTFGYSNRFIGLCQLHKSISGGTRGQGGLVHELGHYLFALFDEYKGTQSTLVLPAETNVTSFAFSRRFFCPRPIQKNVGSDGHACLMDGGSTGDTKFRTEWCTKPGLIYDDGFEESSFASEHSAGYATEGAPGELGTLIQNEQQKIRGESCWETVVKVAAQKYGQTFVHPTTPPESGDTDGLQPIDFKVMNCDTKVVFVFDRSSSLTEEELANAKRAANEVIDLVRPGSKVGIVSFSSAPQVVAPLTEVVNATTRETLKGSVNAIQTAGDTAIGRALEVARDMLVNSPRTGNEHIVLFTDGHNNTGPHPGTVTPSIAAENIVVHTLGLGKKIDLEELNDIAETTGGTTQIVQEGDSEALVGAARQIGGQTEGSQCITGFDVPLSPGQADTHSIFVDSFTQEALFHSGWSQGACTVTLREPGGTPVTAATPGVEVVTSALGVQYRVANPITGEWKLEIQALSGNPGPTRVTSEALDFTPKVRFGPLASVTRVTYPSPVKLESAVWADGTYVGNAEVRANVRRPDGTTVEIKLFDDGKAGHGDAQADDGIYSNLFTQYSVDGFYQVDFRVDNRVGISVRPESEADPEFHPRSIPRFQRQSRLVFEALSLPLRVTPATLAVTRGIVLAGGDLPTAAADVPCLTLALEAGKGEALRIDRIRLRNLGGLSLAARGPLRVFRDANGDGKIDLGTPNAVPLASAIAGVDGEAELLDPMMLLAGEKVSLLVTGDFRTSDSPASTGRRSVPLAGIPAILLVIVGTGTLLRAVPTPRRRRLAPVLVGCLALLQIHCADESGLLPRSEPVPAVNARASNGTLALEIPASGISGTGASSGKAVTSGATAVIGPTFRVP